MDRSADRGRHAIELTERIREADLPPRALEYAYQLRAQIHEVYALFEVRTMEQLVAKVEGSPRAAVEHRAQLDRLPALYGALERVLEDAPASPL